MTQKISVFGLGKLGCTMMACFAHKGWHVIGVDINQVTVDKINNGESPIYEPGVAELIRDNRERVSATTDPSFAAHNTSVIFIIVPTPSAVDGSFTIEYVENAAVNIAKAMQSDDSYRVIVVTSTVLPGDMDRICKLIEKVSGKRSSEHFGLCYNPDFIALGRIVHDFLNPDMILIGESDAKAGAIVEEIHCKLADSKPTIHRMNWWNAELSKIALNSYCVTKISFANMLAEVCTKMPGGDAYAVSRAVGADIRVGTKYFTPGLPISGPCFPRDARAFSHAAKRFGVKTPIMETVEKFNDFYKVYWIPNLITEILQEKKADRLAILGLTYKEDTTLIEEAVSINVIRNLSQQRYKISAYDPAGLAEAKKELGDLTNVVFSDTVEDCLRGASVCFVATPWPRFKELKASDFEQHMAQDPVIIDAWNLYRFDKPTVRKIGKAP